MALSSQFKPQQLITVINRISPWLLLASIIWLCWTLAKIMWLILAPPQAPALPIAPLQSNNVRQTDYASNFMVFAKPKPKEQAAPPPPNVTLKGVMVASNLEDSSALLDVEGTVKNYRIGKALEGSQYKVIAVTWNEAILADPSDNQVVLTLNDPLELNQSLNGGTQSASKISNRRLPTRNSRLDAAFKDVIDDDRDKNENRKKTPQQAISEAAEALKQNPASYLSRMGVMATGEGYQVTEAMPTKLKNRIGLEAGDKVVSVNGQNVGVNPMQDADLLNQIQQSGEAQIQVQRGEQVITIRQQF